VLIYSQYDLIFQCCISCFHHPTNIISIYTKCCLNAILYGILYHEAQSGGLSSLCNPWLKPDKKCNATTPGDAIIMYVCTYPHTYYKVATANVFQLPRYNFYYGYIMSLILGGSDKGTVKPKKLSTHVTQPSVTLLWNQQIPITLYMVITS